MRWAAAAWLAVWIPAYASVWGPRNFLLLCDVAVLLVWSVRRVGYDRRGLGLQIAIAGALLVVSRFAGRVANLNFAFRDPIWGLSLEPAALHLAATLAFLTAVLYLPTHLVLSRAFGRRHAL